MINLNNNYKFIYNYYMNMNQELCEKKGNKQHEICKLLKSLENNRNKISNDIKSINNDFDIMTKDNKTVKMKLNSVLDPQIEITGGSNINMNQELCEKKENEQYEICKLLKSLEENRNKISKDIKSIYEDLDTITKDNKMVKKKLNLPLSSQITVTGGSKRKLEKGFRKFIKKMRNYFNMDREWEEDFVDEMIHDDVNNIFDFKDAIEKDEEYAVYISEEYEIEIDALKEIIDTPKYGKLVVERTNMINYIEFINKEFKIKEKDDIYKFSNQRLYKRLAILMRTYKNRIPRKTLTKMLIDFNLKSEGQYLGIQYFNLFEIKLQNKLKESIRQCEHEYTVRVREKSELLDKINEQEIGYFIKKVSRILKKFFPTKLIKIEINLERSHIGKMYYKIITEDGNIKVNDINRKFFHDVIEFIKIDYEKYLNSIPPLGVPHTFELPEGIFKSLDTKLNADSMFGSIAYCLSDPILMEQISKICDKKSAKNPIIKYLKDNLKYFDFGLSDNEYISKSKLNKAQQILRYIISLYLPDYLKKNPYVLKLLKTISNQSDDYKIYTNLHFPLNFESYSGEISGKYIDEIIKNFQNLVLVSEWNNQEIDLEDIYWGDHISLNIITDFLNKYFNILIVSISGTNDKIRDGFYVYSSHQQSNINKTRYVILIRHSPRVLNKLGTHYQILTHDSDKTKEKYLNINYDSDEYKSYSDFIKDFIDDIIQVDD